jgi:hypothetical protein
VARGLFACSGAASAGGDDPAQALEEEHCDVLGLAARWEWGGDGSIRWRLGACSGIFP